MGLLQRFREWRERRNEKWHIISSHSELPIGKYQRIIEVTRGAADEIDKSTEILRILTGWSIEDIENLSLVEYSAMTSNCGWLQTPPQAVEVEKEYRVGDFRLRVTNCEELTFAQYIDFQTYAKDIDKYSIELLSVLLVPVGKKYNSGYDIERVKAHIARYLPTDVALSLVAFFLAKSLESTLNIPHSLEQLIREAPAKTMEEMQTKAQAITMVEALRKNGVG